MAGVGFAPTISGLWARRGQLGSSTPLRTIANDAITAESSVQTRKCQAMIGRFPGRPGLPLQDSDLEPRGSKPRALPVELRGNGRAAASGLEPENSRSRSGRVCQFPHAALHLTSRRCDSNAHCPDPKSGASCQLGYFGLVSRERLELSRPHGHSILNRARLPFRHPDRLWSCQRPKSRSRTSFP